MSLENRKREYERLKAAGRLSQDDGALTKEFGTDEEIAALVEPEKEAKDEEKEIPNQIEAAAKKKKKK